MQLRSTIESLQNLLEKTAVLKLNGGLGTSMGLEKAKSLLPVKDGKTFLDLIAEQVVYTREKFGSKVRFILMNRYALYYSLCHIPGKETPLHNHRLCNPLQAQFSGYLLQLTGSR